MLRRARQRCSIALALLALFATPSWAQTPDRRAEEAESSRLRGDALMEEENWRGAIDAYSRSLQLQPNPNVYGCRATAWSSLENYPRAIADCHRALELDPRNYPAYAMRGTCYLQLKDFNRAIRDLTIAAELNAEDESAPLVRAFLWGELEQHELALADFQRVVHLAPETQLAWQGIAVCQESLGNWREATAAWTHCLKLDPHWFEGYLHRGMAYDSDGAYAAARADFERAVAMQPDSPEANYVIAIFLSTCDDPRQRDYQRAIQHAGKTCQLSGGYYEHLAILAGVYAHAGQFQDAVKWQTQAIAGAPADERGELAESLELYRTGRVSFDDRPPVREARTPDR